MKKRFPVSLRIALSLGIAVLAILAAIFTVVTLTVRKTIDGLIETASIELLGARSDELETLMRSYQMLLKNEAAGEVYRTGTPAEIEATVAARFHSKVLGEEINNMLVMWPDGRATVSTPGEYVDVSDRTYFKTIMQTRKDSIISQPLVSRNSGKAAVMLIQVFQDGANQMKGMIAVELGMDRIDRIAQATSIGKSSYAWIIDETGLIFSSAKPDLVMKLNIATADADAGYRGLSAVAQQALSKARASGTFLSPNKVEQILFIDTVSPDLGWRMGITAETRALYAPITRITVILAGITAAALVAAIALAFFLGRWIAAPIARIADIAAVVREGDLTQTVEVTSNDEIGDIGRYFNLLIETIKALIQTMQEQAEALSGISTKLSVNMTQSAAAINEIAANIESIKNRAGAQFTGIRSNTEEIGGIRGNVETLSVQVKDQSESVSRSSAAIEEMIASIQSITGTLEKNADNVRTLTEAAGVGKSGLAAVSADIQEIARESAGLLEINGVMEAIAAQTNLLSMNAAIEAAHAGEAGKGFAVVADEIRKLSENSSEQSKTISTVLGKIKGSIDKISGSTAAVIEQFEAIEAEIATVAQQEDHIRGSMEEQNIGSRNILEAVAKLNDLTRQVQDGQAEMLKGSHRVAEESKNLENLTAEIASGLTEMSAGANQINTAMQSIHALSGDNKDAIDTLVKEVARFKV